MKDLKSKLTSRKFWAAIVSFVSAIAVAFNFPDMTTQQVVVILSGIGALVCYIFGEAYTDGKYNSNPYNDFVNSISPILPECTPETQDDIADDNDSTTDNN